jgi:multiple sugar transport system permease protein
MSATAPNSTRVVVLPKGAAAPQSARSRQGSRLLIWVFLAPTLIGLGLFNFVPILGSLLLAFFRWDVIEKPEFVGLDNFAERCSSPCWCSP